MRPVFARRFVLGFGSIGRMPIARKGARNAKARIAALALMWWFISVTGSAAGAPIRVTATHGPFTTRESCDQMRAWVLGKAGGGDVSPCWTDGKP